MNVMETRTLLLDAAGPSAAQYIALPEGRYELSLLRWDNHGTLEPSAFKTTRGDNWVSHFYLMAQTNEGAWLCAKEFGQSTKYSKKEDAFKCFKAQEWHAERVGGGDIIVSVIVYIPAGRQLPSDGSYGKMHIQFKPILSDKR